MYWYIQYIVMKEKSKWERQECMTDTNVVERWHARGGDICGCMDM
jgi:hypothetical protein